MDQIHEQLRAPPYKDTVLRKLYALVQARDADLDLDAVATASFEAIGSLPTFQQTQGFLLEEDVEVRCWGGAHAHAAITQVPVNMR